VNTAFLYGTIDEEVYMKQPTGFTDETRPNHVCKLLKSLYGTKQAARQWNQRLDEYMTSQGFHGADADPCIYVRINDNEYTIMAVYVDDIITVSKDMKTIDDIKIELKKVFEIKDLGDMQYCLGIEVKRDRSQKTIYMSQDGYVKKVAERFGLLDCKPTHSPADANSTLRKMDEKEIFKPCNPYREMIGSLMYAMVCSRPDIADAVGSVSKYCERYSNEHWIATKRIVKYLKTTSDYALKYDGRVKSGLVGYADANWASDPDTRKSTTGYVFLLNGGAVSWKSKRQSTVATSSTEAEYMSLYSAVQEAIWLKRLLVDLHYDSSNAVKIYQDNQGTIALAKNPTFHDRTKHIDIKYHFTREQVNQGNVVLEYLPTNDMVADALTKPMSRKKIEDFARAVNMCSMCNED
jgi:ribonuclease HI